MGTFIYRKKGGCGLNCKANKFWPGARNIIRAKARYRYDADETFYDAEGFKGCPHKLRQFHRDNLNAAGPPKRLEEWLRAWENDELIGAHTDDNTPTK